MPHPAATAVIFALAVAGTQAQDADPARTRMLALVEAMAGKDADGRRAVLDARLREAGVSFVEERFATRDARGTNLVATFGDRAPSVVLTAHLDRLSVSPGAVDNASGCAVLLEVARGLATAPAAARSRRIHVVFTDGEKSGQAGASEFIRRRKGEAILAHLNVDAVGFGETWIAGPRSPFGRGRSEALLREAAAGEPLAFLARFPAGDHEAFAGAGADTITLARAPAADVAKLDAWFAKRRPGTDRPPKPELLDLIAGPRDRATMVDGPALGGAVTLVGRWLAAAEAASDRGEPLVPELAALTAELAALVGRDEGRGLMAKTGRHVEVMEAIGPRGIFEALRAALDAPGGEAGTRRILDAFFTGREGRSAVEALLRSADSAGLAEGLRAVQERFAATMTWDAARKSLVLDSAR